MSKVFVALSGGVDSSVAAWLLKKLGHEVTGVFMKFWQDPRFSRQNACCTIESERRARAVARNLKIPFLIFDFKKEFKKEVVDYYLKQTSLGLTPNPCVVCNKKIKLGMFLGKAIKLGADYVATGHYARKILKNGFFRLSAARDRDKDQSYFLWQLSQKQLAKILFPIGGYTKIEVRNLAKKHKLPTAETKESQDLCFLSTDPSDFLKANLKSKPGKIIIGNKIIGRHPGFAFYTIGQREGIVSFLFPAVQSQGPFYVLKKDIKNNALLVTRNNKDLHLGKLLVKNTNFAFKDKLECMVKIRSKQQLLPGKILKAKKPNQFYFKFDKPARAVTPGQSAVFYIGNEVLGGGTII